MRKVIFIIVLFLLMILPIYAHSGRTDENGCHCCYTDECYGEYHCHNNGKKYIPEKKKVCPGPGQESYYPKETEKPAATVKEDSTTKKEENNTDYGGLIIGAVGGSIGTALLSRKKNT